MANIKSAKKRISVINRKTARNKRVKGHVKSVLKDFDAAIAAEDFARADETFRLAEKKLRLTRLSDLQRRSSCRLPLRVPSISMQLPERFPDWQKD